MVFERGLEAATGVGSRIRSVLPVKKNQPIREIGRNYPWGEMNIRHYSRSKHQGRFQNGVHNRISGDPVTIETMADWIELSAFERPMNFTLPDQKRRVNGIFEIRLLEGTYSNGVKIHKLLCSEAVQLASLVILNGSMVFPSPDLVGGQIWVREVRRERGEATFAMGGFGVLLCVGCLFICHGDMNIWHQVDSNFPFWFAASLSPTTETSDIS